MNSNEQRVAWKDRQDLLLSVIIPTYNRRESLLQVLDAYAQQEGITKREYEIVLADDGSTDGSMEAARLWAQQETVTCCIIPSLDNKGPAHARNRAVAEARGRIVLITGDDILPPPEFLAQHVQWHHAHPEEEAALLGRVVWPDDPPPTPFMRWLEKEGRAFYFAYPESTGEVSPDRFYTCNVSLKRALVSRCGGFQEDFPFASHEDIEMGMRLAEKGGMRLSYDPDLKAIHNHILTPESSVRRVYLNGYSSILYWQRVSDDAGQCRRAARRLCRDLAGLVPSNLVWRMATLTPRCGWYALLALAYWHGAAHAARGSPTCSFSCVEPSAGE